MVDKPNPFLKLMQSVKKDMTATPKPAEKNISDSVSRALTSPSVPATAISSEPKEKATMPELTPQTQRLLGAGGTTAGGPTTSDETAMDFDSMMAADELQPSGMQELASMNTESLEPQSRREANLNVQANQLTKRLQLDSAESVRELCDRIDSMIEDKAAANLQGPGLLQMRNYVQSLMVTLKTRPEFDSVIIAKDVRNVMQYIRATRDEALSLREVKTTKKTVRAAKKEQTTTKAKGFENAFHAIMFGGGKS